MHFQWGVTPMKKTNKNKQLFIFKCFIFFSLHLNIQHPFLTRVAIFREKKLFRGTLTDFLFTPSEFCLFRGKENARNSVRWKLKCSEFRFEPFRRRETNSEFFSELFSETKTFVKLVPFHSRIKKHLDGVWKIFFAEFCSRSESWNGLFRIHRIPRKEHFFPRNNKNRSECIRGIISERNFDSSPNPDQRNSWRQS